MRITDRYGQPAQRPARHLDRPAAKHGRSPDIHGELPIDLRPDRPDPSPCRNLNRRPLLQALLDQVLSKDPDSVPAHLRNAPVGIAIIHKPLRPRLPNGRGPNDSQHPIPPDAEAPITQPPDQLPGEVDVTVGIGNDHEVIPGALPLGEPHAPDVSGRHEPPWCRYPSAPGWLMLAASIDRTTSSARAGKPGPAGSQVIRGSRRNHDSCRRTNLRVAVIVCAAASSRLHS